MWETWENIGKLGKHGKTWENMGKRGKTYLVSPMFMQVTN